MPNGRALPFYDLFDLTVDEASTLLPCRSLFNGGAGNGGINPFADLLNQRNSTASSIASGETVNANLQASSQGSSLVSSSIVDRQNSLNRVPHNVSGIDASSSLGGRDEQNINLTDSELVSKYIQLLKSPLRSNSSNTAVAVQSNNSISNVASNTSFVQNQMKL